MPELRKDPITGRWVIISSERGKRPTDFQDQRTKKRGGFCPFCAGNERTTPNEILAYRDNGQPNGPGWRLRAVPNKFPALQIEGDLNKQGEGIFDKMNGIGAHEVIIESPDHNATLATLPQKAMEEVLWAYRDRMEDLKKDTRFQYTLIFKNEGLSAGATLEHTHSQLIALPIVPIQVQEEIDGCKTSLRPQGALHLLRHHPAGDADRDARGARDTALHRPRALRPPLPVRDMDHCPRNTSPATPAPRKRTIKDLAGLLQNILRRIDKALSNPPYNYVIHTSPFKDEQQRLLSLAHRAHAQADERGGFRMGVRVLHQSHAAGGSGEVPAGNQMYEDPVRGI